MSDIEFDIRSRNGATKLTKKKLSNLNKNWYFEFFGVNECISWCYFEFQRFWSDRNPNWGHKKKTAFKKISCEIDDFQSFWPIEELFYVFRLNIVIRSSRNWWSRECVISTSRFEIPLLRIRECGSLVQFRLPWV